MDYELLHIYAQDAHHDEAFIVGTLGALEALKAAIGKAIRDGAATADAFVNDGEGFRVVVMSATPDMVNELHTPYTADYARSGRTGKYPVQMLIAKGGEHLLENEPCPHCGTLGEKWAPAGALGHTLRCPSCFAVWGKSPDA